MSTVTSQDGTVIAYERSGEGPPLILVDGALCYRDFPPQGRELARLLAEHFSVITYDRRGRGESGDTAPYAIEREVEDLAALIDVAGGSASVYGISSGAALALEAAGRGLPIERLALYEAPFIVDDTHPPLTPEWVSELDAYVAADRRGAAVKHFMRRVGLPAPVVAVMRLMPAWKKLCAVAHTLPYDIALVGDNQRGVPLPAGRWDGATMPALVLVGGKSPDWMTHAMSALAGVLPAAEHRVLEGQNHMVKPKALAPALVEFISRVENAVPSPSAIM